MVTFWWDFQNIEHIAKHGVEPYEAEEVVDNAVLMKKAGRGKYLAYGQTDTGRYLLVVFAPKSNRRLRIVTARDLTRKERRYVEKRGK